MAVALDGNNPGGILDGAFARGQHGYTGPHGAYASFAHLSDGVNAMRLLLLHSYIGIGADTPTKVANKWAPKPTKGHPITQGNDPIAYAQRIAKGLGIGVTDKIAPARAMALAMVMAKIENGAFPAKWAKEQGHA